MIEWIKKLLGLNKPETPSNVIPITKYAQDPVPTTPAEKRQTINAAGLRLIKEFEGCYLNSYPDPASPLALECQRLRLNPYTRYTQVPNWKSFSGSPWTIGWGATGNDIGPGMTFTQKQADERLLQELEEHMEYVRSYVQVPLTDNQFAALTSFTYNTGPRNLKTLVTGSNLNSGTAKDYETTAERMLRYNKAQGKELGGLTRRRKSERNLFLATEANPLNFIDPVA